MININIFVLSFTLACTSQNLINDSGKTTEIITPLSTQETFVLSVGEEYRFIIEGNFDPSEQVNQVDVIFGSYSASSTIEVYLFENNSEEAIWGKELTGETAGVYSSTQDCISGCNIGFIGKALHTQGTEDVTLKVEVRSALEKGQIQITPL
jgi:hypothetical protein